MKRIESKCEIWKSRIVTGDCIVQWLTRSPDTREIPSSSLGIVIFSFQVYCNNEHKEWVLLCLNDRFMKSVLCMY